MNRWNRLLGLAALGAGALVTTRAILRRRNAIDFNGRVVFITGGSRGLGLVLAREFAAEGARVVIVARDIEELARAECDLTNSGADAMAIAGDITEPREAEAAVAAALERFGRIDVLVNNAGTIQAGPAEVMLAEDYEEAMRVHLMAPMYLTNLIAPQMKARGGGRIVNIASIGGKISVPHLLPYNTSKFALVGYSEGLRAELAKDGIAVTTICPGLMRTGSPRNAWFKGQHRAEFTWFSLSDAMPLLSMSAESAARQIVEACRYGDAEVVLSLPAKAAAKFHDLFPGLTSDILGLVNRLLPGPGGIGTARAKGYESETAWSPSFLTTLNDEAARRNNEM